MAFIVNASLGPFGSPGRSPAQIGTGNHLGIEPFASCVVYDPRFPEAPLILEKPKEDTDNKRTGEFGQSRGSRGWH